MTLIGNFVFFGLVLVGIIIIGIFSGIFVFLEDFGVFHFVFSLASFQWIKLKTTLNAVQMFEGKDVIEKFC